MKSTDLQLLESYVNDADQAAFTELVDRHLPLVLSAAQRITRDMTLAEEATQIVFTKLSCVRDYPYANLPLLVWLHRISRSVSIDLVRAETSRRKREQTAAELAMSSSEFPWEEISPVLDQALAELPEKDRYLILLRYFEGESHAEVAKALGIPTETAKKRANRALEKLRKLLARRGITTTTAVMGLALPAHAAIPAAPAFAQTVSSAALHTAAASPATIVAVSQTLAKATAWKATAVLVALTTVAVPIVIHVRGRDPIIPAPASAPAPVAASRPAPPARSTTGALSAAGPAIGSPGLFAETTNGATMSWQSFVASQSQPATDAGRQLAAMSADSLARGLDEILRLEPTVQTTAAGRQVTAALLAKEPALVFARSARITRDRNPEIDEQLPAGLARWAEKDPAAACTWLDEQNLPDSDRKRDPIRLATWLTAGLLMSDRETAIERWIAMPVAERGELVASYAGLDDAAFPLSSLTGLIRERLPATEAVDTFSRAAVKIVSGSPAPSAAVEEFITRAGLSTAERQAVRDAATPAHAPSR